jgi:RNA 2',3'-cyclic 3'-phosphodiesterase
VRLFAGVWPPDDVLDVLQGLNRPQVRGVRWTTRDQWHVTLAFLGDVPEAGGEALEAALAGAAAGAAAPLEARLGPSTVRLGRSVLCVAVDGLDEVAATVRSALAGALPGPGRPDHPYRGHLTLARARGGRPIPAALAGAPVEARWTVGALCLVCSTTDRDRARYRTLFTATVPS